MKNQKGFSLIELLIVVVIIGIIAAIAIPNLLASRRAANESSAISTLRTVNGANATYYASKGKNKSFAADGAALLAENLVDEVVAGVLDDGDEKSGYKFDYAATGVGGTETEPATVFNAFTVTSAPATTDGVTRTGSRYFFLDQSGVIREDDAAITVPAAGATAGGTPIG